MQGEKQPAIKLKLLRNIKNVICISPMEWDLAYYVFILKEKLKKRIFMIKKENISIYNFLTGGDICDKQNKDHTCSGINNSGGNNSIGYMLFK